LQDITLPFSSSDPLSVFFSRGSGIASELLVDIVLSDTIGRKRVAIGDLGRVVYPKRATKLFQCLTYLQ
jgi:L-asparaginase II